MGRTGSVWEGCAARRSRPVFRLETLRWNLEIERAGNQVQVGSPGLGQGSAVGARGGWKGKSWTGFNGALTVHYVLLSLGYMTALIDEASVARIR